MPCACRRLSLTLASRMPVRVIRHSERPHYIVGLMSGTSADGIDAVVAKIAGTGRQLRVQLIAHRHQPFPKSLRTQILHASLHGTVSEICELNFLLGEHFARAALGAIRQARLTPRNITAIGSHGQTVHHLPRAKTPSTLQIGEPAVIAEWTGITTIADFRVGDMAAGGEGAPLVTYVDWALYTHDTHPRILQNIGGIGNLTYLPPRASLADVIAFDTGPGNMVIDAVVAQLSSGRKTYDRHGRWAARGVVSQKLLGELMRYPYLRRRPPKTTGREEFGEPFVQKFLNSARRFKLPAADVIATATAFTATSIADAHDRFVFKKLASSTRPRLEIILGGGGAKNPTLRKMLADRVAPSRVLTQDDLGYSNAAKEALAFAVLAHETLQGQPTNVPAATGARHPVVLGKIVAAR
jgi:anhydro-N-acetylmuramic acid kinase